MRLDRKKLLLAMFDNNLNQKELAKIAGVSRMTVNSVRNGRSCSQHTAESIAKALKVSVKELMED